MSENKRSIALVHEICPICGKPMNEQILMNTVFSKKYAKEIENMHGKTIGYSKTACENCTEYKDKVVFCIAIDENKSEPIVYLYNTHQTEEYSLNSTFDYSVKPNVMISSYILREKLNNLGINTIVETNNMKEFLVKNGYKYNMSYHASEYFARLKDSEYPSIRYLFDIHRDSLGRNSTVLEINDKKYAKVLFVVGLEHTTKDNNVGFAEKLDMETNNLLRGLSRGVSYKTGEPIHGVYNQNLFGKSVLIEVGGVDNTIEEVNNTMEILSKVIESVVKEEMNA